MPPPSSNPSNGDDTPAIKVNDERTPLLAAVSSAPLAEAEAADEPIRAEGDGVHQSEDAPFPRTQILLLCYTRLVEPIAFFAIFPYINAMIEKTGGIDKKDVGFYSGLIESLFSATQMCVMVFWGKAADKFGRKPVLAFSLFGVSFSTALFGFSQSIWQMIFFRCIAGVFAGTVVTVRVMLTENSTKNTQARVFSWFAFVGNIGIFVGPFLGGGLESPADKFKSSFGRIQFFHDYPYALPGFASAAIGLSAAILTTLFVKETLHLHKDKKKQNEAPMTSWELVKHPGVAPVMVIFNYVMLLAFAFTAIYPVFLYEPVEFGGLGLPPSLIAAVLAGGGAAQAAWVLIAFPPLHKRFGTIGVLKLCAWMWPVFFAADSMCNILLRHELIVPFWILLVTNVTIGCGVAMAFTCVQLALNDISPSYETLGTLNALVLAAQSGLRAVSPASSTSIYALTLRSGVLQGQLFWVVMVVIAIGLNIPVRFFPEKAAGRPERAQTDQA